MPDTDDDEQATEYFYRSAGGCPRCDAMEGYYSSEPSRPHPNCMCEIIKEDPTLTRPIVHEDAFGHNWYFQHDTLSPAEDRDGDDYYESHPIHGTLFVECCGGEAAFYYDVELELVLGPDDDTAERQERRFEELAERVDEIARQMIANCPPCNPPLVS